jgi:hypothetical protein
VAILGKLNRAELESSDSNGAIEFNQKGDGIGIQFGHITKGIPFGARVGYLHKTVSAGLWGKFKFWHYSESLGVAFDPIGIQCRTELAGNKEIIPIEGSILSVDNSLEWSLGWGKPRVDFHIGWILPVKHTGIGNETRLTGSFYSLALRIPYSFDFIGLFADASYSFSMASAEMTQDNTKFAYLDTANLSCVAVGVGAEWKKFTAEIAYKYFDGAIGNGTYFEVWPCSYWDFFTASKYRLVELENSVSDFLVLVGRKGDIIDAGVTAHFLFSDTTDFVYKKRVAVIYPILFRYEHDTTEVAFPIDGLVELNLKLNIPISDRLALVVFGHQLIPFKFGAKLNLPGEGVKPKTHGGTLIGGSIEYCF